MITVLRKLNQPSFTSHSRFTLYSQVQLKTQLHVKHKTQMLFYDHFPTEASILVQDLPPIRVSSSFPKLNFKRYMSVSGEVPVYWLP